MTSDAELQEDLSARMTGLVAHPPAGRNLMPGIRKAAHRRRTRVAAISSTLGVTGVVVAGAVTTVSLKGSPSVRTGVAAGTTAAAHKPAVKLAAKPAAKAAVTPSAAPTTQAPPTSKTGDVSPVPSHVPSTSLGDSAADLQAAPYYYQHTLQESSGQRTSRRMWIGQSGESRLEQPSPVGGAVESFSMSTDFLGESGQHLTWADFSSDPTPSRVHAMLFGGNTSGSARSDRSAFKQVHDLLFETPTTAAFRLALLPGIEQIPGVTVQHSVTDEIGRAGERLSLGGNSYVIDPADGRLLQEDEADGCDVGQVGYRTVLLESGPVAADNDVLPEIAADPTSAPAGC